LILFLFIWTNLSINNFTELQQLLSLSTYYVTYLKLWSFCLWAPPYYLSSYNFNLFSKFILLNPINSFTGGNEDTASKLIINTL
jgi:hypothetical protein